MVAYGFDLGYRGPITPGPYKNLLSALFHHKEITWLARSMFYLSRSCMFLLLARWRKILLFASSWIFLLVRSGKSVNDGIDKLEYSVQYQSFDDAVDLVRMPSVYVCMYVCRFTSFITTIIWWKSITITKVIKYPVIVWRKWILLYLCLSERLTNQCSKSLLIGVGRWALVDWF